MPLYFDIDFANSNLTFTAHSYYNNFIFRFISFIWPPSQVIFAPLINEELY